MPAAFEKSDQPLLELLRETGGLGIQELMDRLSVTATAVRQRLDRLCAAGLVEKEEIRAANRGRPSHRYRVSDSGLRSLDGTMVDLARIVWDEIKAIDDPSVRDYLLKRISHRLAEHYSPTRGGDNSKQDLAIRLEKLAETLRSRQFPVVVQQDPGTMLPILKINGCPYPDLSGQSHDICEVEEAMFSELLGSSVKLRHCRCDSPDGGCVFDVIADSTRSSSTAESAS
jgi:predicted ArsR family transcriptional regulator